jgi:hypothetical protein
MVNIHINIYIKNKSFKIAPHGTADSIMKDNKESPVKCT